MKEVKRGKCFSIVDDFLCEDELTGIRKYLETLQFRVRESVVNPLVDGSAMVSRGSVFRHNSNLLSIGHHEVFSKVLSTVRGRDDIYGAAGHDWRLLTFAFWQYPAGSRLSWHNDAGNGRTGEYVLYLHEEWDPSWGGELILLDKQIRLDRDAGRDSFEAVHSAVARSEELLTAVHPRPNRLVMMQAGTCHYISRIEPHARFARRSLTGFASNSDNSPESISRLNHVRELLGMS